MGESAFALLDLSERGHGGFPLADLGRKFFRQFRKLLMPEQQLLLRFPELIQFQIFLESLAAAHGGSVLLDEVDEKCESAEHEDREIECKAVFEIHLEFRTGLALDSTTL